jgi:hypothetical protein
MGKEERRLEAAGEAVRLKKKRRGWQRKERKEAKEEMVY